MFDNEKIRNEIQLAEGECCIIFDFGCFFPYANPEVLTFEFSLGEEKITDFKLNHRYPNRGYQTISKKMGLKVSKVGYPYIMKLDEQETPILLCLKIGIKEEYMTLIFPLLTSMTKEKPFCVLELHYDFDAHTFRFGTYEPSEDGMGWYVHNWRNFEPKYSAERDILLGCPTRVDEDDYTVVYNEILTPYPINMQ